MKMAFKILMLLTVFLTSTCVESSSISRKENLDFSNKNLTSVPRINSACVTHLILSHNLLTRIKYGDFNRMINLTFLDVSNNRINVLNKMSFKGLTLLKVLNMSSNLLSDDGSLPEGLFQPLSSSLLELDIRHNLIYKKYPEKVIKDLISLRILKLDCVNGRYIYLLLTFVYTKFMSSIFYQFAAIVIESTDLISTELGFTRVKSNNSCALSVVSNTFQ